MLYMIIGTDAEGSLKQRMEARPAHVGRLKALAEEGRLVMAGPNPAIDSPTPGEAGYSGSLIVAEFASLEAAQAWADLDPYIEAGVYERVEIKPFLMALTGSLKEG